MITETMNMMNKFYQIQCRYEYWSLEGKCWTKWFNVYWEKHKDKEIANSRLKIIKDKIKSIDKNTKLNHEYQIVEVEK